MDKYQELKKILFQAEQERIREMEEEIRRLRQQLEDKERLIHTLSPVISDSLSEKIRESRDEMAQALAPVMGAAIKRQINDAREEIVDALYPVIGQTIRKSIAEAMKKLVASINQRIDQAFSFRSLKLRFRAWFTGVPYQELVLREALPFRLWHIYLIQKESGLLIARVSTDTEQDHIGEELVSGMLTAIRNFAGEAFRSNTPRELTEISYEDLTIYLENSRYVYLAFVAEGVLPENFPDQVHELETELHRRFGKMLRAFRGERQVSPELKQLLERFLQRWNPREFTPGADEVFSEQTSGKLQ